MEIKTLLLPKEFGTLIGGADGLILRTAPTTNAVLQRYQFTGVAVSWLLATPDGSTLVAAHTDGLVVVFDTASGEEIHECSVQLQSEYNPASAQTWGELSNDGRYLWACIRREDVDIGLLIDLNRQNRPHRQVGPHGSSPAKPAQWP